PSLYPLTVTDIRRFGQAAPSWRAGLKIPEATGILVRGDGGKTLQGERECPNCVRAGAIGTCDRFRSPPLSTTLRCPSVTVFSTGAPVRSIRWYKPPAVAGRTSPKAAAHPPRRARRSSGSR